MTTKKAKSFNHEVYTKAYKRLNLSPTERAIFQRLLGFLIRNDRPFPYSATKIAEITGFSLRTIFYVLDSLEKLRLITRIGMGKNRKFKRGSILCKILTTVQNRRTNEQYKNSTTVQLVHQNLINRATGAYNKTSLSLKHKEGEKFSNQNLMDYQEYFGCTKSDIKLGLLARDTRILSIEEWLLAQSNKTL